MTFNSPIRQVARRGRLILVLAIIAAVGLAAIDLHADDRDPFEAAVVANPDPFDKYQPAAPLDDSIYAPRKPVIGPLQINFQIPPRGQAQPSDTLAPEADSTARPNDPCAAVTEKPLSALGINIAMITGRLPQDHAAACWESLNEAGPLAAARSWPGCLYHWDATSLCHRPLYFEEINLERYGYGCCACLQPAASAAHFFGTVPALPYCMAAECPGECVYTLGHYRPGSCPPWRRHWPPCDPLAAAAEGGVLTGLIFLIP